MIGFHGFIFVLITIFSEVSFNNFCCFLKLAITYLLRSFKLTCLLSFVSFGVIWLTPLDTGSGLRNAIVLRLNFHSWRNLQNPDELKHGNSSDFLT